MKLKHLIPLVLLLLALLAACGKDWTCDNCGKDFHGDAYYDYSGDYTLCEDCARKHWTPFPYTNYKK